MEEKYDYETERESAGLANIPLPITFDTKSHLAGSYPLKGELSQPKAKNAIDFAVASNSLLIFIVLSSKTGTDQPRLLE